MTWEQKYEVAGHITLSQKAEKEECWPALGSLPPFYLVRIPMGWRHLNSEWIFLPQLSQAGNPLADTPNFVPAGLSIQ